MEDNKKQISAEFNKVYEDITNAYEGINEFYMKHGSLGQDDIDNRIVHVLADIWDMLGKCKEMGDEVAEHLNIRIMGRQILQYVTEKEILFTDKEIFKDNEEHSYMCKCFDGVAVCTSNDEENELPIILATYPKKSDVMADEELCESIRAYRGLDGIRNSQITYGDIMAKLGELAPPATDLAKEAALEMLEI